MKESLITNMIRAGEACKIYQYFKIEAIQGPVCDKVKEALEKFYACDGINFKIPIRIVYEVKEFFDFIKVKIVIWHYKKSLKTIFYFKSKNKDWANDPKFFKNLCKHIDFTIQTRWYFLDDATLANRKK